MAILQYCQRSPDRLLTRSAIYAALLSHQFQCHLVDIRDFEAKDLIDSGIAVDLALSILA